MLSRIAIATLALSAALVANWLLQPFLGRESPFLLLLLAIVSTAYYAGIRAALLVTAVSTIGLTVALFRHSINPTFVDELVPPVIFCTIGSGTSWFVVARKRALDELTESNRTLKVLYDRERQSRLELDRLAEQVRQSEQRYRIVAMLTGDALWDWDVPLDRIEWADGMSRVFGYKLEEIGSEPRWWQNRIHPDDRDRVVPTLRAALASSVDTWASQFRFKKGDGTFANVVSRGRIIRSPSGLAIRMIGSMLDLSEQKQAEKALAENHRFLQRLLRRVPSPVVLLDPRGHIVLFNRACEQISGFRRREVVGRTIPETILAAEDVAEFERRVADPYAPEAQVEFDCRIRTKAGELRPIEWRFTLVPAPDGGMPYMVGAGTEMEQRKTALAC